MDNISIKRNIKRLRINAGMTHKDMAIAMDISLTAYKNLENSKTRIIFDRLDILAAALHVTPEEVLLGYQPLSPDSPLLKSEMDREAYIHEICDGYEQEARKMKGLLEEKDRIIKDLREYIDTKNRLEEISGKEL